MQRREKRNLKISIAISAIAKQILVSSCEVRYLSVQAFTFLQTLEFEIASASSVATSLVVEIKDKA